MSSKHHNQSNLFTGKPDPSKSRVPAAFKPQPPDWVFSVEGAPAGERNDLLRISEAPDFTAYPNPDLAEFVAESESLEPLALEPFAADVAEGKNDPYYGTFNYHTKVPPLAIARYILHYTRPGEVVLDAFCGSGMTGLAAALCGAWPKEAGVPNGELGARRAVLIDLSPVATFLSFAFTRSVDGRQLLEAANTIAMEARQALGHLYEVPGTGKELDYVVWSDIFVCPDCSASYSYWEAGIEPVSLEQRSSLLCPSCGAESSVREAKRLFTKEFDPVLGEVVSRAAEVPVKIFFAAGREREPAAADLEIIAGTTSLPAGGPRIPRAALPDGVNTEQPRGSHGIAYVHQFYTWRNLRVLSWLHERVRREPPSLAALLEVIVLAMHARASRRNRYIPKYGHRHVGVLSGTLYVPPLREESNLIEAFSWRARKAARSIGSRDLPRTCRISTQSATDLRNLPENTIDYCFVDPPFGANINYSELNFLWEAWLGAYTNTASEAIVNSVQGKGLVEYQNLMTSAFREICRVLKPGHWMTLEFHNSKNSVWAAIQEALWASGFVVADVRTLDKKKGTIKQLSTVNIAKQDLIVSAYKPTISIERSAGVRDEGEGAAWLFVGHHLKRLPVVVDAPGGIEIVSERQPHVLYDRMVSFHVQRGAIVPLGATEFLAGLRHRFSERDGMYFLHDQVAEYDRRRVSVAELRQLELFITDEASSIQWLRRELSLRPRSFQELQPEFMRELQAWAKHEEGLELLELLRQNFLCYEGEEPVPGPIHAYLSTNFRELRNLPKDDRRLVARAIGRWYVPDPKRQGDLEQVRQKALLKEFERYKRGSQQKLKAFRTEAIRAGFKAAYDAGDYSAILQIAGRLPEAVLQEDEKLLMYYDVASTRLSKA